MNHCTGPCDQGRLPCPCPAACGLEEPPEHDMLKVVMGDLVIAAVIVAVAVVAVAVIVDVIAAIVLGMAG